MAEPSQSPAIPLYEEIELSSVSNTTGAFHHDQQSAVRRRPLISQEVPDSHRNLQLTLHSTGAYAVTENTAALLPEDFDRGEYGKTQHRLFNEVDPKLKWRPWLSGPLGRILQLLTLSIAFISHYRLVQYTREDGNTKLSQFGPSILGTLLAMSTRFLYTQELRRSTTQISNSTMARRKHLSFLLMMQLTIIALVAPLMCIPVLREAESMHTSTEGVSPYYVKWDPVADNLQDNMILKAESSSDMLNNSFSQGFRSVDPRWEVRHDNLSRTLPNPVFFSGQNKPRDFSPVGSAADALILLRPFQPTADLPSNTMTSRWPTTVQWVLSGYLECEKLDVPSALAVETNGTSFSTVLPLVDSHGCSAEIEFSSPAATLEERQTLRQLLKDYVADLGRLSDATDTDHNVVQKAQECERRLNKYSVALQAAQDSVVFKHHWLQAKARTDAEDSEVCQRRYMFAGFADAMSILDSSGKVGNIQAASCITHFQELKVDVDAVSTFSAPFRRADIPIGKPELADLEIYPHKPDPLEGILDPNHKHDLIAYAPWGRPRTLPRDDQFHTRLDEFMLQAVESRSIFDDHTPLQNLQYQFLALSKIEDDSYHSIALGSKLLMLAVHQMIIGAASITLLEQPSTQGWYSTWEPYTFKFLQIRMLQTDWWFQTLFFCSIAVSVGLLVLSHCFADDGPSGLPWDVTSIAARAALLCKSSLPRSFQDNENGPESVYKLSPLRIGHFALDEKHSANHWKIDSLLNQRDLGPPEKADLLWRRHSLQSLPLAAGFFTLLPVTGLLFLMVGMMWNMWNSLQESIRNQYESKFCNMSILFLGKGTGLPSHFTQTLILRLLPAIMAMVLAQIWWKNLLHFYKERLPWAGLTKPQASNKNITLDYINDWFPLAKALKNKHWMLSTVLLGSFALVPLPMVVMNFYHHEWILYAHEITSVPRTHIWDMTSFQLAENSSMTQVLQEALRSIPDSSALPTWSSYQQVILPVDLASVKRNETPEALNPDEVGYWEVETAAVRAELDCDRIPFNVHRQSLELSLPHASVVVDPCFNNLDESLQELSSNCSHWQLVDLSGQDPENTRSFAWVISATQIVKGVITSPQALLCHPKFYKSNGTAQLVSLDGQLRNARIHGFSPSDEKLFVSEELGQSLGRLINDSLSIQASDIYDHTGLQLSSSRVAIGNFRGDILSLMTYKWALQAKIDLTESEKLGSLASNIFSTIFAIAVPELELFDVSTPDQMAEVTRKVWVEDIKFNKPLSYAAVAYLCLFLLVMCLHSATILRENKYLFPIPPEPLENSLYLLYRSNLIHQFEEQIPHPDNLSLRSFYKRVDELGLLCYFGSSNPDEPLSKPTVIADFAADPPSTHNHRHHQLSIDEDPDGTPLLRDLEARASFE